jgi:hypothetical protein
VNWPRCAKGGGYRARMVKRRRWQRRRPTRAVLMAVEETGSSGVDGGRGDQRSRERWSREQRKLREISDEK